MSSLFFASTVAVFVKAATKCAKHKEATDVLGSSVVVARARAPAALIIIPISRHSLTFLRRNYARFFFMVNCMLWICGRDAWSACLCWSRGSLQLEVVTQRRA
jgi:hypothetical protein